MLHGNHNRSKSAFVPFSNVLFNMIHELHLTLLSSLELEESSTVILHTIRALTTLMTNVSYAKLTSLDMLRDIIVVLKRYSESTDRTIQSAALGCLSAFFGSISDSLPQILSYFEETDGEDHIQHLLHLMDQRCTTLMRTESAQVLSNISKCYPRVICRHWLTVMQMVEKALKYNDQSTFCFQPSLIPFTFALF